SALAATSSGNFRPNPREMKSVCLRVARCFILSAATLLLAGCSDLSGIRRTLREVSADKLRAQTLAVCREGFATGVSTRIDAAQWPESARAFKPLGLW